MTDGTATGIITAGALKSEMDRKREMERQRFARLDAATTGRGAETVRRPTRVAQGLIGRVRCPS